jgi:hypothetical protein
MASKTKPAKHAARKQSAPNKKTSTARRKKPQRAKILAQGIGVVSSIGFSGTKFENQFLQGANVAAVQSSEGDYDRYRMATAVQHYNDDPAIGLIVSVGGLSTAMEVLASATKPWIALIGGAPGTFPSSQLTFFRGAVSLESYTYNKQRLKHLTDNKGIQLPNICLLVNKNNPSISAVETHDWPSHASPPIAIGQYGANDPNALDHAFDNIPANVTVVMLSGDPYFQDKKDRLVPAANQWVGGAGKQYVVYPFRDYKDAQPPPTSGKRICHGPSLTAAYYRLGQQAASVLSGGGGFPIDKRPIGNPDET